MRGDAAAGGRGVADRLGGEQRALERLGVDTSGLGAPLFTAMPMPVRAISVRPGATLPA